MKKQHPAIVIGIAALVLCLPLQASLMTRDVNGESLLFDPLTDRYWYPDLGSFTEHSTDGTLARVEAGILQLNETLHAGIDDWQSATLADVQGLMDLDIPLFDRSYDETGFNGDCVLMEQNPVTGLSTCVSWTNIQPWTGSGWTGIVDPYEEVITTVIPDSYIPPQDMNRCDEPSPVPSICRPDLDCPSGYDMTPYVDGISPDRTSLIAQEVEGRLQYCHKVGTSTTATITRATQVDFFLKTFTDTGATDLLRRNTIVDDGSFNGAWVFGTYDNGKNQPIPEPPVLLLIAAGMIGVYLSTRIR